MNILGITDATWVRNSFLVPAGKMNISAENRKLISSADYKFTDSTLGGNYAINTPYQFTSFADIKRGRVIKKGNDSFTQNGMGRYYSEAIDDNNQLVHIRFGVPTYTSMTQFFGGFYNAEAAAVARTGRGKGLFYSLGRAAGWVISVPFIPFSILTAVARFGLDYNGSKYYYLKPTMPIYWNTVNTIANGIAANMGVVPREKVVPGANSATTNELSKEQLATYAKLLPDIFVESGGIDVYAIANRAQRLAAEQRTALENIYDNNREDYVGLLNKIGAFFTSPAQMKSASSVNGIDKILELYVGNNEADSSNTDLLDTLRETTIKKSDRFDIFKYLKAELEDGSAFVTFRVDNPGTANESFSNSTRESDIASTINGMSSSAKNKRFSFSDGNVGDGAIISTIEGVMGAVGNLVGGVMDQFGVSGLASLAGRALVDIPKHWDSSSANLPRMEYTIELRSPYGDTMSRFMNLYVPLACLLAGALPLATGKQSYTSPFICEVYSQGRAQTKLGIIDSLSISRGVGNLGWNNANAPLGIDISFSIIDMSSIMSVSPGPNVGTLAGVASAIVGDTITAAADKGTWDEDNAFSDYLAVLGSLTLSDQMYFSNKANLRFTRQMNAYKAWRSPAHAANWAMGGVIGRVASMLAQQGSRN